MTLCGVSADSRSRYWGRETKRKLFGKTRIKTVVDTVTKVFMDKYGTTCSKTEEQHVYQRVKTSMSVFGWIASAIAVVLSIILAPLGGMALIPVFLAAICGTISGVGNTSSTSTHRKKNDNTLQNYEKTDQDSSKNVLSWVCSIFTIIASICVAVWTGGSTMWLVGALASVAFSTVVYGLQAVYRYQLMKSLESTEDDRTDPNNPYEEEDDEGPSTSSEAFEKGAADYLTGAGSSFLVILLIMIFHMIRGIGDLISAVGQIFRDACQDIVNGLSDTIETLLANNRGWQAGAAYSLKGVRYLFAWMRDFFDDVSGASKSDQATFAKAWKGWNKDTLLNFRDQIAGAFNTAAGQFSGARGVGNGNIRAAISFEWGQEFWNVIDIGFKRGMSMFANEKVDADYWSDFQGIVFIVVIDMASGDITNAMAKVMTPSQEILTPVSLAEMAHLSQPPQSMLYPQTLAPLALPVTASGPVSSGGIESPAIVMVVAIPFEASGVTVPSILMCMLPQKEMFMPAQENDTPPVVKVADRFDTENRYEEARLLRRYGFIEGQDGKLCDFNLGLAVSQLTETASDILAEALCSYILDKLGEEIIKDPYKDQKWRIRTHKDPKTGVTYTSIDNEKSSWDTPHGIKVGSVGNVPIYLDANYVFRGVVDGYMSQSLSGALMEDIAAGLWIATYGTVEAVKIAADSSTTITDWKALLDEIDYRMTIEPQVPEYMQRSGITVNNVVPRKDNYGKDVLDENGNKIYDVVFKISGQSHYLVMERKAFERKYGNTVHNLDLSLAGDTKAKQLDAFKEILAEEDGKVGPIGTINLKGGRSYISETKKPKGNKPAEFVIVSGSDNEPSIMKLDENIDRINEEGGITPGENYPGSIFVNINETKEVQKRTQLLKFSDTEVVLLVREAN
ncbi:MAG: hypothetical protein JSV34_06755, partial [Candidatus Omnitrophota bacterium]